MVYLFRSFGSWCVNFVQQMNIPESRKLHGRSALRRRASKELSSLDQLISNLKGKKGTISSAVAELTDLTQTLLPASAIGTFAETANDQYLRQAGSKAAAARCARIDSPATRNSCVRGANVTTLEP